MNHPLPGKTSYKSFLFSSKLTIAAVILILFLGCRSYKQVAISGGDFYSNTPVKESFKRYNVYIMGDSGLYALKDPSINDSTIRGVLFPVSDPVTAAQIKDPRTGSAKRKHKNDLVLYTHKVRGATNDPAAPGVPFELKRMDIGKVTMYASDKKGGFSKTALLVLGIVAAVLLVFGVTLLLVSSFSAQNPPANNGGGSNSNSGNSGGSNSGNSGGSNSGGSNSNGGGSNSGGSNGGGSNSGGSNGGGSNSGGSGGSNSGGSNSGNSGGSNSGNSGGSNSGNSGGSNSGGSNSGCYIATMVYRSYEAPEVMVLRKFRDEVLSRSKGGRLFIKKYYAYSPLFVKRFKNHKNVNRIVKVLLDKLILFLKAK